MEIENLVKRIVSQVLSEGSESEKAILNPAVKLKEIGVSSLDYIKIIVKIEEETGIEYPEECLITTDESDLIQIIETVTKCLNESAQEPADPGLTTTGWVR